MLPHTLAPTVPSSHQGLQSIGPATSAPFLIPLKTSPLLPSLSSVLSPYNCSLSCTFNFLPISCFDMPPQQCKTLVKSNLDVTPDPQTSCIARDPNQVVIWLVIVLGLVTVLWTPRKLLLLGNGVAGCLSFRSVDPRVKPRERSTQKGTGQGETEWSQVC